MVIGAAAAHLVRRQCEWLWPEGWIAREPAPPREEARALTCQRLFDRLAIITSTRMLRQRRHNHNTRAELRKHTQ